MAARLGAAAAPGSDYNGYTWGLFFCNFYFNIDYFFITFVERTQKLQKPSWWSPTPSPRPAPAAPAPVLPLHSPWCTTALSEANVPGHPRSPLSRRTDSPTASPSLPRPTRRSCPKPQNPLPPRSSDPQILRWAWPSRQESWSQLKARPFRQCRE